MLVTSAQLANRFRSKGCASRPGLTHSDYSLGQHVASLGQCITYISRIRRAYCEPDSCCTSVNTRARNASNSSAEWKRATWPETRCSTRPSQDNGVSEGWKRNCTTKA